MAISAGSVSFEYMSEGFLEDTGRYWADYFASEGTYETDAVGAPGVHGTQQVHKGFRGRTVFMNVTYVSGSYGGCLSDLASDSAGWEDQAVTVTGYEYCYLVSATPSMLPNESGNNGTFYMEVPLVFMQRVV